MSDFDQVIYDFGMNNGDDLEYYLLKGVRVVGVEANERLCSIVRERFSEHIKDGRLTVLNVALTEVEIDDPLTFYIHKSNHVLSQLPTPPPDTIHLFEPVQVRGRTPAGIIREFGPPLYVKIDVEHYDQAVLSNLFSANIFPPEISAESHSVEIFSLLVVNGYNAFSLVEGSTVATKYRNAMIRTAQGLRPFTFRYHSAGPFGEDIRNRWEDRDTFLYTLAAAGLGWKDIHASMTMPTQPPPRNMTIAARQAVGLLNMVSAALKWHVLDRWTAERRQVRSHSDDA
jgi:FkbM family methyltransferase